MSSLSVASMEDHSASSHRSGRIGYAIYGLCIAASIATWFLAIGEPLWIDETGSYWVIEKGFRQIAPRVSYYGHPAYYYILWLATKVLGTSEIAMRVPSMLTMLAAAWLVYLAAREMFERDVAATAVVVFCLEPVVAFASVDVGVYAFATLVTTAGILLVLRVGRNESNRLAALLGLAAAVVMWFHYLFAVIAPALVVCLVVLKWGSGKTLWRQLAAAAGGYAVGVAPVLPGLVSVFRTRGTHVYMAAPTWADPLKMLTPGAAEFLLFVGAAATVAVTAVAQRREGKGWGLGATDGAVCAALAVIPMGILLAVSALTPMHVSGPQWHLLSSAPGIALLWAWLARGLRRGWMRVVFCLLVVAGGCRGPRPWLSVSTLPSNGRAIAMVEKDASRDGAPVVMCSNFVESNYVPMPQDAKESRLFAELAYYRLSVPVVPLPEALNAQAVRIGGEFVERAAAKRERFLAMGSESSYPTLDWLAQRSAGQYSAKVLGVFSSVKVVEFTPRLKREAEGNR